MQLKLKEDKYRKARGGRSKLLTIFCGNCNVPLFTYQKDGSGILKRLYLDRIISLENYGHLHKPQSKKIPKLTCPECNFALGISDIYAKEKRNVFRLFVGAVIAKIAR